MVKFSLNGGDEIDGHEDGSGSSSNRKQPRKKQKLTATASAPESPPPSSPPVVLPPNNDEEDSEDAERHDEEEEYVGEAAVVEELEHRVGANGESENQQRGGVNQNLRNQQAAVDEKQVNYDKRLTLILTDPDVLDCPICFENLQSPVFQCENGHISCVSCCLKIHNKCPSCSFPIGYNRCRAIEKILETSQVSCKNSVYGCKHIMKYQDKHKHERLLCIYSPCSCPIYDCDFIGSARNFYQHFDSEHFATTFHFGRLFSVSIVRHQLYLFLKEENSGTIFVVNQFTVRQGKAISVVQIAGKSNIGMYRYELKLKDGETLLILQSHVECVPNLDDYRCSKHFLVVEDFVGPNQRLKFDIRVTLHAN